MVLKGAWKILNDAMFYRPALRLECRSLACAALELARETKEEEDKLTEKKEKGNPMSNPIRVRPTIDAVESWWDAVGVGSKEDIYKAKETLLEATQYLKHGFV